MYHITFDVEWSPDWSIIECADLLEKYNVKGTFFMTHKTKIIDYLYLKGHNIGIHPNFLPGSTQGNSEEEVINYMYDLVPNATCVRTHSLVQSTPLLEKIFSLNKNLKYDFSLLTPEIPLTKKISWQFNGIKFWRLNFQWEDDAFFDKENYDWLNPTLPEPISILNFHPLHISLNTFSISMYKNIKNECRNGLTNLTKDFASKFINNKQKGAKDTLKSILNSKKSISFEKMINLID